MGDSDIAKEIGLRMTQAGLMVKKNQEKGMSPDVATRTATRDVKLINAGAKSKFTLPGERLLRVLLKSDQKDILNES